MTVDALWTRFVRCWRFFSLGCVIGTHQLTWCMAAWGPCNCEDCTRRLIE